MVEEGRKCKLTKRLLSVIAGLGLTIGSALRAECQETRPDRVREEAEFLARRADELRAAGQIEEAAKLSRRAEELRLRLDRPAGDAGADEGRKPWGPEEGMKRELAELRARLKKLDDAGRNDEAAELRRRVRFMEEQLERAERRARPDVERERVRDREEVPGPWLEGRPGQERMEPERRMQLVRQAVENLHAAGLHEIAERVAMEARRIEDERRIMEKRDDRSASSLEIDRLRTELVELRKMMREMQEQVEVLRGDRR